MQKNKNIKRFSVWQKLIKIRGNNEKKIYITLTAAENKKIK